MKVISVPIAAFDEWIAMPGEEIDRRAGAAPGEQVVVNFLTKEEQAMQAQALLANQPMQALPTHNGHYKGQRARADLPPTALRTPEAARYLGIGERLLIKIRDRGEIPCVRISSAVCYLVADLDAFLSQNRVQR